MNVCFTGHRAKALCGYRSKSYTGFVQELKQLVLNLYESQYARVFYTGGAQGFDQLAFWAVAYAKKERPDIQNHLVLPDRFFQTRWPEDTCFGQKEFRLMLQYADSVQYMTTRNQTGIKYLFERNHRMVDLSDTVIGLYTGTDDWRLSSTKGGTAECLRYAWNAGKQIIMLDCMITDEIHLTGTTTVSPQWP